MARQQNSLQDRATMKQIAGRLDQSAAILIGLLWPLLLVPSPTITGAIAIVSSVILSVATLFDARAQGKPISAIFREFRRFSVAPWTFSALAALVALALASTFWSIKPYFTLNRAWQFAAMIAISCLFLSLAPRLSRTSLFKWLALGPGLAVLLILADRSLGHPILKMAGLPALDIEYGRASLHFGLMAFPALVFSKEKVWVGAGIFSFVLIAVFFSTNEAAKLGVIFGVFILAVALLRPALAYGLIVVGFVGSMLVLPLYIGSASVWLAELPFLPELPLSFLARTEIWTEIQNRLMDAQPLGIGLEATRHTPAMDAIVIRGYTMAEARAPFHPHSMPLQIMYELGIFGSLLVLTIGLGALRWCLRQDRIVAAISLASFSAMFGAFLVANSTWPTWRIALMALIAGLLLAGRDQLEQRACD